MTMRQEAVRAKTKLEADVADLEVQLTHANHQSEQAIRVQRELKGQNKRLGEKLEIAGKETTSMVKEQGASERRANLMQAELEELRISVEQAEKARKQSDAEVQAANDRINELMMEINGMNKVCRTSRAISYFLGPTRARNGSQRCERRRRRSH